MQHYNQEQDSSTVWSSFIAVALLAIVIGASCVAFSSMVKLDQYENNGTLTKVFTR